MNTTKMNTDRSAAEARKAARGFHNWYFAQYQTELGCEDELTERIKAAIEKAIDEANHFATLEESQIESRAAHASEIRRAVDDQGRPIGHTAARASEPIDLEAGGKLVRDTWIAWAKEQPNVKSSWLVPWEELSEPDKEVDRRIYAACRAARATEHCILEVDSPWTPQMLSRLFDAECSPEQAIERICYLHNATLQPARASESEPWKPISQGGKADEPHDIRIDGQHCVEVGRGLRIVLAICDAHNATLQPAHASEGCAAPSMLTNETSKTDIHEPRIGDKTSLREASKRVSPPIDNAYVKEGCEQFGKPDSAPKVGRNYRQP